MDSIRRESRLDPIASLANRTVAVVPAETGGSEISESVFVEQEELYFRTAAQSRGVFYYHALSLLLVPLLATLAYGSVTAKGWFLGLIALTLALHVGHLIAFFFAKTLFTNWVLGIGIEAMVITSLCLDSGGILSIFKFQLFLLIHYAIVRLERGGSYIAGAVSAASIIILYFLTPLTDSFSLQDLAVFMAFIAAAAALGGGLAFHSIRARQGR